MGQNPSTEAQIPVNDPNGKMTVIELADENGGVAESITIRNDPSEILIGGQPVTTPEEVTSVKEVIKQLANEAGQQRLSALYAEAANLASTRTPPVIY